MGISQIIPAGARRQSGIAVKLRSHHVPLIPQRTFLDSLAKSLHMGARRIGASVLCIMKLAVRDIPHDS